MADFIYKIGGTGTYISQEDRNKNVLAIQDILQGQYGWTLEAIAGAVGCFSEESGMNPGIYETSHSGTLDNLPYFPGGMGLAQWTDYPPYTSEYPNPLPWSADHENKNWYDGNFQCYLLTKADDANYTSMGFGQGPRWGWQESSDYPSISFRNYQKFSGSVRDATLYWFYDFEWHYNVVPPEVDLEARIRSAEEYYTLMSGHTPTRPRKKMSLIYYLRQPKRG